MLASYLVTDQSKLPNPTVTYLDKENPNKKFLHRKPLLSNHQRLQIGNTIATVRVLVINSLFLINLPILYLSISVQVEKVEISTAPPRLQITRSLSLGRRIHKKSLKAVETQGICRRLLVKSIPVKQAGDMSQILSVLHLYLLTPRARRWLRRLTIYSLHLGTQFHKLISLV